MSQCPKCGDMLPYDVSSCVCGWQIGAKAGESKPVVLCVECDMPAVMRVGPDQLCAVHYDARYPEKQVTAGMNYRERWYAERGLPYQPPKLGDMAGFRCLGRSLDLAAMTPKQQMTNQLDEREPGCDDEEVGHEATA